MKRPLTVRDVQGLLDVMRIDDLLLLPQVGLPNISESLALQKAGIISLEDSLLVRSGLWLLSYDRDKEYAQARRVGTCEPAWAHELPIKVLARMRYQYAVTQEEPLAIVHKIPYTGISYMIVEDGLCELVCRTLGLFRLQHVNQLGFLQAPWVERSDTHMVTPLTQCSRLLHSYDVQTLATMIGHNLDLGQRDFNTLRVAALSHDRGTPAGGDSIKLIDPKALDEDLNYERLLREKTDQAEWEELRDAYSIDEPLLIETILNKGLLGEILDISDKLAYVARDIDTCLHVAIQPDDGDGYVGARAVRELTDESPLVCDVWDSVRIGRGRLVFSDVARLISFLKVRIVLFREMYFHPRARFGEYMVSRILAKKLYDAGELTRDDLLEMTDDLLRRVLERAYGQWDIVQALSTKADVRSFATREDALRFKEQLTCAGNPFSLIEDHLHAIKPGTHFLVDSPQGPLPLIEAYPADARELYEMATMLPAVHVYYLGEDNASPRMQDLFSSLQFDGTM